jgi:serine/threonine-protein kinase
MNIGERVGDYEIIQILGAGGMGQVYKVRNTLSERVEAMKVLLPKLEGEQGLADRFLREIKTQATFDHPNIAKLHTAMRVGNQLVMIMEFVDGVSLAKELEKGPLAPGEAAAYTAQVLDALAYAHGRGVVHRDIKPANIMITDAGVAKLMDFGIARVEADSRLTQTGAAVGSLAYMSPEQINGSNPDPRSDIYSLGITLYEMVTGKRPFEGDSGYSIMSAHLKQTPVAPIELTPGLPPDLSDIILMAIAKEPAGRFQSAAAFRGALVSVFPGIAAPMPSQDSTQTMPLGVPVAAKAPAAAPRPTVTAATVAVPPPLPPTPIVTPAPVLSIPMMPAAPLPPSAVTNSGRRGIYMALGSVVTVAVLVAAVIEGPKLMHGGLSDAFGKGTSAPAASASPSGPPAAPANDAASTSASTPDAAGAATASDTGTPASVSAASAAASVNAAATATPAKPLSAPTATASAQPIGKTRGAQVASADGHRLPETPAPAAPLTAPAQTAQNFAPAPSPAPAPQAAPATPPPPAVNPELGELRQKFNETSIRATTARTGLNSFQQQQARQGLGLRADIREAQTRMDYQLQEATAYLQRGDIDNARTSLRYAQNAVETIEKFLGR